MLFTRYTYSHLSDYFFSPPPRNKTANGDCRKDPRERSRSPIERAVAPTMSLHGSHLYTSLPSLSMEQPLALTKNSMDASRPTGISPTLTPVERQQVRLSGGLVLVASSGFGAWGTERRPGGSGKRWWVSPSSALALPSGRGSSSGDSRRGPFTRSDLTF